MQHRRLVRVLGGRQWMPGRTLLPTLRGRDDVRCRLHLLLLLLPLLPLLLLPLQQLLLLEKQPLLLLFEPLLLPPLLFELGAPPRERTSSCTRWAPDTDRRLGLGLSSGLWAATVGTALSKGSS